MPDIDGFEVAKRIRASLDTTQIVFVTTEDSLVYDSFDYQPFCFIPKTTPEILNVKLETVIKKLAANSRKTVRSVLNFHAMKSDIFIPIRSFIYTVNLII